MQLYLPSGYLDVEAILSIGVPFIFVTGGRGTGKTFGFLDYFMSHDINFAYMRRTQRQLDIINKPDFSPFNAVDQERGTLTVTAPISVASAGIYHGETSEDGKIVPTGSPLGFTCALATISNMRSFDASATKALIYDEFIPERQERPIRDEGAALLNAYETINRNRELKGQPPLQFIGLSNANDLGNPIFLELQLVRRAEQLRKSGQEVYVDRERGIALVLLQHSPISERKAQTAVYRAAAGTDFASMALENEFSGEDPSIIKSLPLRELRPLVQVGELCIYKHKSKAFYYASCHASGSPRSFGAGSTELKRFQRAYLYIWQAYLQDRVIFEEYLCEILLRKYFK